MERIYRSIRLFTPALCLPTGLPATHCSCQLEKNPASAHQLSQAFGIQRAGSGLHCHMSLCMWDNDVWQLQDALNAYQP